MSKELITIIICSILLVVITAAVIALFAIDYKQAKAGKKAYLWERKKPDKKHK